MANSKKTIIHCCIEKDIYEMLMKHCNETGQTKTTAVKRAIKAYCQPIVDKELAEINKANMAADAISE